MADRFTFFDVIFMNASFFLLGSGLYLYGIALFCAAGLLSGFINSMVRNKQ